MATPVTFEKIKAYKRSAMNIHDAYAGDYDVEVQSDGKGMYKARVKSNNFFVRLAGDGISRLNKLNRYAHYGDEVHCYMTVNGQKVFFALPNFHNHINQ